MTAPPLATSKRLEAAAQHIARYKLPEEIAFRDRIERSLAGQPDCRWAGEQVKDPVGSQAGAS